MFLIGLNELAKQRGISKKRLVTLIKALDRPDLIIRPGPRKKVMVNHDAIRALDLGGLETRIVELEKTKQDHELRLESLETGR